MKLDDIDLRLLRALEGNGRATGAELAEEVGISRATAYTRVDRLTREGVIDTTTIRVRPEKLGLPLTALILLSGGQQSSGDLREMLPHIPEIQYAAYLAGSFDIMVVIRARDMDHIRDLCLERFRALPGIRATQTMFVIEEVVNRPNVWL
ncbi:Lrp/AsnC family transcriptional regulator [Amycolatopsis jejuensis]|uniref:Lrp/AsnC family transcriptional regulator n=1 Tax=Amycolatopsis jejuensis TaxID=330084 RepID=UPI000525A530|nr:Lrp/AsnC family transcriptional regulator [Amycolatopsis jejuensis]